VLRGLARPVSEVFAEAGLAGLEKLPGVGESIAHSIRDILRDGRLAINTVDLAFPGVSSGSK
jgi:DNA polymerase/3'-5' exonuclease PolX